MEYGNGMQFEGFGQGGEGYEISYDQIGQGQVYGQQQQQQQQQQSGYGQSSNNNQNGSAAFGGPGYRSPLRYNKMLREMNSRNGLYSPMEQQRGGAQGDYYNSLPGLGGPEGQMYQSGGNQSSYY